MKRALVLGGASCLWEDADAALSLSEFDAVIACNDAASTWPGPLAAMVTLHAEKVLYWRECRRRKGFSEIERVFVHTGARRDLPAGAATDYVEYLFAGQVTTGSSGLFALKVALVDLGFDRAVLCGVPMTSTPHFFDTAKWDGVIAHKRGWQEAMPQIAERARSMSGWTAEALGVPTEEWLGA